MGGRGKGKSRKGGEGGKRRMGRGNGVRETGGSITAIGRWTPLD